MLQSSAARVGVAAIRVLLPITRFEAIGNMANLHWYMLYLIPWGPGMRGRSDRGGAAADLSTRLVGHAALCRPAVEPLTGCRRV